MSRRRKFIFQFDVNGTVMAKSDRSAGKGLAKCSYDALAKSAKYHRTWNAGASERSSYAHHLLEKFPGVRNKELRESLLEQFPTSFANGSWDVESQLEEERDRVKQTLTENPYVLLPSVRSFLEMLHKNKIPHHLVLRSFGTDISSCTEEISQLRQCSFEFAKFKNDTLVILNQQNSVVSDPIEIQHYINTTPYLAIQDEWKKWDAADNHRRYGKPFFFEVVPDPHDPSVDLVPVFFDDNIGPWESETSIVSLRGANHNQKREQLYDTQLFPVDTFQAVLDDEYYVRMFRDKILPSH